MRTLTGTCAVMAALFFAGLSISSASAPHKLTYAQAKRAIQAKADQIAGASTEITAMFRLGRGAYSGSARWERTNPTGCRGCGYDPITGSFYDTPSTESCSVGMRAKRLPSGRIRVGTENFFCF